MIARAIGCSVEDVYRLRGEELEGWDQHFAEHAPGDFLTHRLLARGLALFARWIGVEDARAEDFAPWLPRPTTTPDSRATVVNHTEMARRAHEARKREAG